MSSGTITFVSELNDGSTSDKEIVIKSGILEKELCSHGDSVMADCGFTMKIDLKELNVYLNMLSFLGGRVQLTAAEVKESQAIVSVKIHVERAIQTVNPNLGGGGGVILPHTLHPPLPPSCWFFLNNSETVRAVTLSFYSVQ